MKANLINVMIKIVMSRKEVMEVGGVVCIRELRQVENKRTNKL